MAPKKGGGADNRLAEIVDELYTAPPESFIAIRDEHVKALAGEDEKALAAQVQALRKPTLAAWAVNVLVRTRREQVEQFVRLGSELATAQRELDGATLQTLATRRQRVVHALVREARELAADAGHPIGAAAAYEVESTLHAALADPTAAERLLAAQLLRPESYAGFGPLPDVAEPPRLRAVSAGERPPTKDAATRAEERRHAHQLLAQAEAALEEAQRRQAEAAEAVREAEEARRELDHRAASLREQLADLERRTAEVDLDRRRLSQIAERAGMHLVRARDQVEAAQQRLERASGRR